MQFDYRAYNSEGKIVTGVIEGLHEQDVIDRLGVKDLMVVALKQIEFKAATAKVGKLKVSLPVQASFTRQLATMLRAGLPLLRCLQGLQRQINHRNLQFVLGQLSLAVEAGDGFSDALNRFPQVFSPIMVAMVRAGETGGILPDVLERLATYLEMNVRLRQRIRSAMVYPMIVSTLGLGVCVFMITVIIPVFVDIFKEFGRDLPLPTLILINTSTWIRTHLVMCAVLAGVSGWTLRWALRTPKGTAFWDRVRLCLPVFGPLARKIVFARFTRTFASLTRSGVPVLKTLEIAACAVGNVTIAAAVQRVAQLIQNGATLHEGLDSQKIFPAMMLEMVSVGEQTGTMDDMLSQVADYYDREVETTLANLTSMLEPLLILFLGVVVGSVVAAMFLPIFKMTEAVQF